LQVISSQSVMKHANPRMQMSKHITNFPILCMGVKGCRIPPKPPL